MKTALSKDWSSSTQTRKQRKYRHNAPHHVKSKFLSVHLDEKLRKEHNTRSLRVRTGDSVKVVAGAHKGTVAKVSRVSLKYSKVYVEGIENTKADGTKSAIPIDPSNLMITEMVQDKKRVKKTTVEKKTTEKTTKESKND